MTRQADDLALTPPRWGFAERLIHTLHMPEIYSRLFLLVQFQTLSLADFGDEIRRVDGLAEISSLRERWIQLRNRRWFVRVSSQVQGEELYRLMQQQAGIEWDLDLLNAKLRDLEAVVNIKERISDEQIQKHANRRR